MSLKQAMFERTLRSTRGFSLIEIIVTIAIVATLAAIAVPLVLSQRGAADEAAQKSDILNVSSQIENVLTGWQGLPPGEVPITTANGTWAATPSGVAAVATGKLSQGNVVTGKIYSDGSYFLLSKGTSGKVYAYSSATQEVTEGTATTTVPTNSVGGGSTLPAGTTLSLPTAVTSLTAVSSSPGQVYTTWGAVPGATGYTVKVTGVAPITVTTTSATVSGVGGGLNTVTVYAKNVNGAGPGSSVTVAVENAGSVSDTAAAGTIVQSASSSLPDGWLVADGSAVSRTLYATLFSAIGTTYGAGDGTSTFNLPNLNGRVVVGQDTSQTEFNTVGKVGGEKTHTLTIAEMPAHGHTGTAAAAGDHSHVGSTANAGWHGHSGGTYDAGNHNHVQDSHQHGVDRGFYPNNWEWWPGGVCNCGSFQGRVAVTGGWGVGTDWRQPYIYYSGNHNHSIWTNGSGDHTHTVSVSNAGSHTHAVTVGNTGGGAAFTNLQPYIVLRQLIKTTPAVAGGADPAGWEPRLGLVERKLDTVTTTAADIDHTHPIGDVTGLQAALDSKSLTTHTHDTAYYRKAEVYTKAETDGLLAAKTDNSVTNALSGRVAAIESTLAAGIDGLPTGSILQTSRTAAPAGWMLAQGQAISRSTYSDLFASIGTTYGAGDGSTTFNIPDLRGRNVVGLDSSQAEFNVMGKKGGEKYHTLTTAEMPSHNHGINDPGHSHYNYLTIQYMGVDDGNYSYDAADGDAGAPHGLGWNTGASGTGISIQYNGGNAAHNVLDPYITLNFMIRVAKGTVAVGDTETQARVSALEFKLVDRTAPYVANSSAARDAKFGVPADETARLALQNSGAVTIRTDTGWTEQYYATYNAATNPGGASPAGWYPVEGTMPDARVVRSTTGYTFSAGTWHTLFNTAHWTNQKTPTGGITWDGRYTVSIPGEYQVEASVFTNGIYHTILCLKKNSTSVDGNGYQSSTTNYGGSGWNVTNLTKRLTLTAGDAVGLSFYAGSNGTSTTYNWNADGTSYFGIRYIGPPRVG